MSIPPPRAFWMIRIVPRVLPYLMQNLSTSPCLFDRHLNHCRCFFKIIFVWVPGNKSSADEKCQLFFWFKQRGKIVCCWYCKEEINGKDDSHEMWWHDIFVYYDLNKWGWVVVGVCVCMKRCVGVWWMGCGVCCVQLKFYFLWFIMRSSILLLSAVDSTKVL